MVSFLSYTETINLFEVSNGLPSGGLLYHRKHFYVINLLVLFLNILSNQNCCIYEKRMSFFINIFCFNIASDIVLCYNRSCF